MQFFSVSPLISVDEIIKNINLAYFQMIRSDGIKMKKEDACKIFSPMSRLQRHNVFGKNSPRWI